MSGTMLSMITAVIMDLGALTPAASAEQVAKEIGPTLRKMQQLAQREAFAVPNVDLHFLLNEVLTAADAMDELDIGNPFTAFTCSEAEKLADIFRAADRGHTADLILARHQEQDEAEEIDFHLELRRDDDG